MLGFLKEYIKHPRSVGAVAPSSKYLAYKMIENIDFEDAKCIVEYGPGTGVFTEKLMARKKEDTKIFLIEFNKKFYDNLKKLYGYKENVIIINDSAENIDYYLNKHNIQNVDYVVSGLPFATLPKEVSNKILMKTIKILQNKGEFITFQYSLIKKNFFSTYFQKININKTFVNLPPAYVLTCKIRE